MTQVHLALRLQPALEPKCPIELQGCQHQAPRQVCTVTYHAHAANLLSCATPHTQSTSVPVLFEEALMPVRACEAAAAPTHLFGYL